MLVRVCNNHLYSFPGQNGKNNIFSSVLSFLRRYRQEEVNLVCTVKLIKKKSQTCKAYLCNPNNDFVLVWFKHFVYI